MVLTILAGVGLFWLTLWQLWREARPSHLMMYTTEGMAYLPPEASAQAPSAGGPVQDPADVFIITEKREPNPR